MEPRPIACSACKELAGCFGDRRRAREACTSDRRRVTTVTLQAAQARLPRARCARSRSSLEHVEVHRRRGPERSCSMRCLRLHSRTSHELTDEASLPAQAASMCSARLRSSWRTVAELTTSPMRPRCEPCWRFCSRSESSCSDDVTTLPQLRSADGWHVGTRASPSSTRSRTRR